VSPASDPTAESGEATPTARSISVPGLGRVRVEPDVADVRLGVVSVRPTAAAARAAAAEAMESILAALAGGGVKRPDLRTSLVSLDAVRDYSSPAGPTVTGYQMTNVVEATIRVVDAVGAAIDGALAAGATSLDGLTFRLDDPSAALDEARRLAVADARARAETLASEARVTLGSVVAIVEGGGLAPGPPRPATELGMKLMADATTPIEGGMAEMTVQVAVTFAID
jgi:uncharacterized protein YggE